MTRTPRMQIAVADAAVRTALAPSGSRPPLPLLLGRLPGRSGRRWSSSAASGVVASVVKRPSMASISNPLEPRAEWVHRLETDVSDADAGCAVLRRRGCDPGASSGSVGFAGGMVRRRGTTFSPLGEVRNRSFGTAAGNDENLPGGVGGMRVWEIPAEASLSSSGDGSDGRRRRNRSAKLFAPRSDAGGGGWEEVMAPLLDRGDGDDAASASSASAAASTAASPVTMERIVSYLRHNVLRHFLPTGYPATVAPGYAPYVLNSFVASSCGSAGFVLSTQALLLAVGVGSAEAAPVAAALNWVLKDGLGQLGGVLFASRLGSGSLGWRSNGGSTIDSDPKRWRMVAALALDSATFLEILSPLFPGYFLPIASVANVGKNVSFIAASATRAALHQSLARANNLGDVTAKAGSQTIAASLVGTTMGIGLSPMVGGDVTKVALGFAVLSACHQFCTYRSLRSVALDTLNRHRLNLVLERFVRERVLAEGGGGVRDRDPPEAIRSSVPSPAEIARLESFLPLLPADGSGSWLTVGCGLRDLCPGGPDRFRRLREICGDDGGGGRYLLSCDVGGRNGADDGRASGGAVSAVRLVFLDGADGRDVIRGMLHAHVLRGGASAAEDLDAPPAGSRRRKDDDGDGEGDERLDRSEILVRTSRVLAARHAEELLRGLEERGWRTGDASVCVEGGSAGRRLAIEMDDER